MSSGRHSLNAVILYLRMICIRPMYNCRFVLRVVAMIHTAYFLLRLLFFQYFSILGVLSIVLWTSCLK